MTSREIISGSIAVAVFLAFIATVVVTGGWAFFVLLGGILLALVFMAGASAAGP